MKAINKKASDKVKKAEKVLEQATKAKESIDKDTEIQSKAKSKDADPSTLKKALKDKIQTIKPAEQSDDSEEEEEEDQEPQQEPKSAKDVKKEKAAIKAKVDKEKSKLKETEQ